MKDLVYALAVALAMWASTAHAQLSPPVEYLINQPTYSADFNDDDLVNSADLAIWTASVGVDAGGDADGDNDTDGADYLLWQQQVGASAGWVPIQRLRGDYNTQLHELTYFVEGMRRFLRYTGVTATPQGIWMVDDNDMGSRHQLNHSLPPDRIIVVVAGPVVNGFRPFYYQYFKNGVMYLQTPTVSLPHVPWTMLQQQQQGGQQQQQQQGQQQGGQQQVQEYWTN